MLEEEMKVGPKGQVVIPRAMRKALKIQPGSKVLFSLEDGQAVVRKLDIDYVEVLHAIARRGKSVRRIPPHLYEEELSHRDGN